MSTNPIKPLRADIEVKTKAGSAITTNYTDVGAPLANPGRKLHIFSTVDDILTISLDGGVKDWFSIPAGNTTAQRVDYDLFIDNVVLAEGSQIQVKGASGGNSGTLTITVLYGKT